MKRNRCGFTLIEMLVVIAIIALLASLIVPTTSRALQSAKATKCLSNLRQIGQAMQIYLIENKEIYPFWKVGVTPTWYHQLSSGDYGLMEFTGPGFNYDPILYCPLSGKNGTGGWPAHNADYGINLSVTNHENSPTRMFEVENPSGTVLFAETGNHAQPKPGPLQGDFRFIPGAQGLLADGPRPRSDAYSGFGWMAFRHPKPKGGTDMSGGSSHALFCDGHVESIRFSDPRLQDQESRRKLFLPES